jgi:hypothetical protein
VDRSRLYHTDRVDWATDRSSSRGRGRLSKTPFSPGSRMYFRQRDGNTLGTLSKTPRLDDYSMSVSREVLKRLTTVAFRTEARINSNGGLRARCLPARARRHRLHDMVARPLYGEMIESEASEIRRSGCVTIAVWTSLWSSGVPSGLASQHPAHGLPGGNSSPSTTPTMIGRTRCAELSPPPEFKLLKLLLASMATAGRCS